jgi:hypothetical protein
MLGHETQSLDVTVRAGETTVADFSTPVSAIALEGLTVIGSRALVQAEALARQRNAPNIVNIVASDQMGRFPDRAYPSPLPGLSERGIFRRARRWESRRVPLVGHRGGPRTQGRLPDRALTLQRLFDEQEGPREHPIG